MSMQKPALVALRDEREETIQRLTDAFAADLIDVDEFEDRVDKAHRACDCQALIALRSDVAPTSKQIAEPAARTALLVPVAELEEGLVIAQARAKWIVAIVGGAERKGRWRVPKKLRVTSVMGGALIDFREAIMAPGITEVTVLAVMGGVEIIVPPTLAVECEGWGIAGAFESLDRFPVIADPSRPLLRITGLAIAGGVEISTRLPGESAREARRRGKRERKAREKALSGKSPKQLDQ